MIKFKDVRKREKVKVGKKGIINNDYGVDVCLGKGIRFWVEKIIFYYVVKLVELIVGLVWWKIMKILIYYGEKFGINR